MPLQEPLDLPLVLVRRDRARRVHERPARPNALGADIEEPLLLRDELRARVLVLLPAHVGTRLERAQVRARRVEQDPVELTVRVERVGLADGDTGGPEPLAVLGERLRAAAVL